MGGDNSHAIAYAESRDGLRWEKPDLGVVEFEGSGANNLTDAVESPDKIEVVDPSTVKITLKSPFAPFLERMTAGALQILNKKAVEAADKALEVYTKLREATQLEVEITRRGKPMTIKYSIR